MPSLLAKFALAAGAVATLSTATNITEMPPPRIEFEGKAPKFKIFPGGLKTKNSTWLMLEFGKIQEVDAQKKVVGKHSINSLAAEKPTFVESNTTMYNVSAQMVKMTVALTFDSTDCAGGKKNENAGSFGNVTVRTIIFNENAVVPYDNYTISITKGQMKFNIEAEGWPFCSESNSLMLSMAVKLPGDEAGAPKEKRPRNMTARPPPPKERKDETPKEALERKRPKGREFAADAGEGNSMSLDMPEIALMDGTGKDIIVEDETVGSKTGIRFIFPHFKSKMVYDPSVGFELTSDASTTDSTGGSSTAGTTNDTSIVSGGARISALGALLASVVSVAGPFLVK